MPGCSLLLHAFGVVLMVQQLAWVLCLVVDFLCQESTGASTPGRAQRPVIGGCRLLLHACCVQMVQQLAWVLYWVSDV